MSSATAHTEPWTAEPRATDPRIHAEPRIVRSLATARALLRPTPPSTGNEPVECAPKPRDQSVRLAQLRSAGLVRRASERDRERVDQLLPVGVALRPLLPGLRRGGTVAVSGSTSLLFALLAEASAAGSWCAVVGLPRLGLVAAAEAGIAVERLALVPHPGPDWAAVVGALIDGIDIVVMATPTGVPAALATRLVARARQRGGVLVPVGRWPGADLTLEVVGGAWHGIGEGRGRLRRREVEILANGRGAAARPRRVRLWLPGPTGAAQPPAPTLVPRPVLSTVDTGPVETAPAETAAEQAA
jgi:hypothetical protein